MSFTILFFILIYRTVPGIFTLAALFIEAVDGFSLTGICHISMYSRSTDQGSQPDLTFISGFVLFPQISIILMGFLILGKLLKNLWSLSNDKSDEKSYIRKKQRKIGFCLGLYLVSKFFIVFYYIYVGLSIGSWNQSLEQFLVCHARNDSTSDCSIKNRQNLLWVYAYLMLTAFPGLLINLLIEVRKIPTYWHEFVGRILLKFWKPKENSSRASKIPPKHQIVQKAYAKRDEHKKTGRLEISMDSYKTDNILGLDSKLGQVSVDSEFSSTWARALPRLIQRRNALVGVEQLGLQRTPSVDSLMSLSRASSIRIKRRSSWIYDSSRRQSIAGKKCLIFLKTKLCKKKTR